MMRFSLPLLALTMFAGEAALGQPECQRPESIMIPDGASASLDEMLDAQTGVREFLAAMESYLDCVNMAIDSADEETPPETVNGWVGEYNTTVGEMEAVAARFNEERVAYQQANPSE